MWCCKCNNEFPSECACADRDARLEKLKGASNFTMRVCAVCGKHYSMCKCPDGITSELTGQLKFNEPMPVRDEGSRSGGCEK